MLTKRIIWALASRILDKRMRNEKIEVVPIVDLPNGQTLFMPARMLGDWMRISPETREKIKAKMLAEMTDPTE